MISIDQQYPTRIDIGPDKKFDWVEVSCVGHLISDRNDIKFESDYCDNSKINKIEFDVERNRWIIYKKNSIWGFYSGSNIYDVRLELIEKNN